MNEKDSALSRDRNLAKIELLCNDSGHRDVRLDEKKQTHRRLVNILFVHIKLFSYPKLKSRLKRIFRKKKKNHVDNFGDFCWIGPLKSFNLRRFFRWALGSRGGHMPQMPPPWIRAWVTYYSQYFVDCIVSLLTVYANCIIFRFIFECQGIVILYMKWANCAFEYVFVIWMRYKFLYLIFWIA